MTTGIRGAAGLNKAEKLCYKPVEERGEGDCAIAKPNDPKNKIEAMSFFIIP